MLKTGVKVLKIFISARILTKSRQFCQKNNTFVKVTNTNKKNMLKPGDKMPEFKVEDQEGNIVESSSLIGKKTIIYFYPKDNTPGCTAQACNLRDNYAALKAAGYNIVGVSKDSVASHKKFAEKNTLPFTLLSDTSTQMLQAFGAWGEKKSYGKTTTGTLRRTFIFNEAGILEHVIEKVETKNHTAQILELDKKD